jgi:hypothetical protein
MFRRRLRAFSEIEELTEKGKPIGGDLLQDLKARLTRS